MTRIRTVAQSATVSGVVPNMSVPSGKNERPCPAVWETGLHQSEEPSMSEHDERVREDEETLREDGEGLIEGQRHDKGVTVAVNQKQVFLTSHRVTGLDIKRAAVAQGVEIQEDFLLTLEAHGGHDARVIGDDEEISVTAHSVFTANDGDDDS